LTSPTAATSIFSIFGVWSGNDAERLLADGKRLAGPGALALDHDALEDLDALPLALDHLEMDADRVPRLELRDVTAQLGALECFDHLAHKRIGPKAGAES
jgi:hypothetical protein